MSTSTQLEVQPALFHPEDRGFCHSVDSFGYNVAWHGAVNGVSYAQSSCADVAEGVVWALNNCKLLNPWVPDWHYGGSNAAWGNENLLVTIRNM
ncbi:hypothetical protein CC1G_10002 [Coprinopsis cinerea okayama7|uniref:Uncharacterized protein n=1 Tax=Coprinopsis cinerea (strain Okayama-7 / 130 / ATCC MYA-4618 / FGSC 9003) TaxID=240176 RepID=A8NDJ5_COPC7|nr:hypothetical protein CC1G_10002 [Coprinopsis cinerea okayama7\|eukprot:XP_001832788.2 hypothetical protein CC1G_10002 [Coprinopsis cinerea okayama7\